MIVNSPHPTQAICRPTAGLAALLFLAALLACAKAPTPDDTTSTATSTYQLGVLRKGPSWTAAQTAAEESLQAGHLRNMRRMYEAGLMVAAGPFLRGGDLSGLFVFGAPTLAEIEREVAQDPRIRAGRLAFDLYAWEAPAGIGEPYRRRADRGLPDSMQTLHLGLAKRGPAWRTDDGQETRELRNAHEEALQRMIESGDLVLAGPVRGADDLVAVMIFKSDSATARLLVDQAPAVRAGDIVVELRPWLTAYGAMPSDTL